MLVTHAYRIRKLSDSCGKEWEDHWRCLEMNNQEFYPCRKPERRYRSHGKTLPSLHIHTDPFSYDTGTLNQCVFDKLKLAKNIPGSPEGQPQVHEKKKPVFRGPQT